MSSNNKLTLIDRPKSEPLDYCKLIKIKINEKFVGQLEFTEIH